MKKFYASDEFKAAEKAAEPFFKIANDFVFGRPTTLENAVSAYKYATESPRLFYITGQRTFSVQLHRVTASLRIPI